jgi:hypothetical protein
MNIETLRLALDAQRLPFLAAEKEADEAYEVWTTRRDEVRSLRAKYEKINSLHRIVSAPYGWETPRDVRVGVERVALALGMEVAAIQERMRPTLAGRISSLIMAGEKVNQRVVSEQSRHALSEVVASLITLRDMTPSSD